jgi:hypothetical protein
MQLTIEFDHADQIADIAHLAEIMSLSRKNDTVQMHALYPRDIISSVTALIESFDEALNYIDSPYVCSEEDGKLAGSLACRMQEIGQRILEMKNELLEKPASVPAQER